MAGDWLKVEVTLPDKPEVVRMADLLGIDQDAVTGKCLRFWIWLNQNSQNGHAVSVTPAFVDRLCVCPGFGVALQTVGWAFFQNGSLDVPHFDRHNTQSAKQRALGALRKQVQRKRQGENGPETVTPVSRSGRDRSETRGRGTEISGSPAPARTRDSKNGTTTTPPLADSPEGEFEGVPFKEIVTAWAELCPELLPVEQRTNARDRAIATFWKWCGAQIDQVRHVFKLVGQSNLLNGRPHRTKTDRRPYKTRFDWVINPENAARIVEGQYSDEPAA